MSTMALGPAGPLDHLPGGLTPGREFPRPRPTAATPAPAASSAPTVPIPSDRDRAEPVGTPLLRLTPPLGDTPPAPAKLDALGDAAKLQFADSVARYSHADWERQQQAEPTCHAARRYSTISRPSALPADFIVLPFAQPTAFTAGCRLVRRSVISPGNTRSVFWHRTTLEPHARSGSAATVTRCSPREPAFGTRATMACGGLKKSVRERQRMGCTRSDVWTIRGRLSSLFPRRGTQPRRGPYEVLGPRFT